MDVAVIVRLHSPPILKFSRTLPEVEVRTQMSNAVGLSVRCHGPGLMRHFWCLSESAGSRLI